ncbi:MAG: hypothetical protein AUH85_16315 [Chloroflexi bacterium 13_1_40CM_4_68_4]|nr:MAG: hypothetical protein AUH85_16315 [Chloroflexi bacterium 13_1_40CM_4_68_4]
MLELAADFGLASLRHQLYQLAVDQLQGPQVSLAMLLNYHTLDTEKNALDLLERYGAVPEYLRQHIENLREGMAERRTAPRIACERVIAQVKSLLATPPEESPYGRHARKWVGVLSDDLVGAVRDDIYPAFASYLQFLESDYRPRGQPGLSSIPRGGETYAELVRQVTQSELTPEQVHRIGTDDLRAIHEEIRAIGVRNVRDHAEILKANPHNHFRSADELIESAQHLYDRAFAGLPRLFGHLPLTSCRVIPIESYRDKDSPAAFYNPPAADGSRPGTYYVNTHKPETRPRYNLPALTVHESVPGHHLQIAIQSEAADIPRFRRHRLGTQGALVAFTEGWGLYSERLGDEMGMYGTEPERFGMLSYQAWRAARLVIDTGIHAGRSARGRGRERDRPVYLVAESGPRVQDRPASHRGAAPPAEGGARLALRRPSVPRRAASSWRDSTVDGDTRDRAMAERSADLALLARYNAWANEKVFTLALRVESEKLARKEGYDSIAEILRHLVHVESNFLLMSLGEERVPMDEVVVQKLAWRCLEIDAGYERLAETSSEADLEREFLVPWFGFNLSVREAVLQALTHAQKHRADVCMLLPALGVEVPGLDLIQWLAESRDTGE